MRRLRLAGRCGILLAAAGLLATTAPGTAQNGVKNAELYRGGAPDVEGIRLGSWGSGRAKEDTAKKAISDASIRIETNGYYAGGRLEFDVPREITDQKADPSGYLAFTVFFQPGKLKKKNATGYPGYPGGGSGFSPASRGEGSAGGSPPFGGFSGGAGFSGAPGGFPGGPGGFPGGPGYPGYPGAGGGAGQEEGLQPDTSKLKVVLKCEEGTFVASNFPVTLIPATEEGWFQVAIPFVAFKGLDRAPTAKIKEIRIFGDSKDTFWIGEIRTTTDEEPIAVEPLDDAEVSVQEPVEFRAQATGGISPLQYSWDFDLSDGIQEDAVGPVVTHTFRNASKEVPGGAPGDVQPYVVTLTVKDLSGAKRPVRRTANVIVNP